MQKASRGMKNSEGCPPPQPTRWSGEHWNSPSGVQGGAQFFKTILVYKRSVKIVGKTLYSAKNFTCQSWQNSTWILASNRAHQTILLTLWWRAIPRCQALAPAVVRSAESKTLSFKPTAIMTPSLSRASILKLLRRRTFVCDGGWFISNWLLGVWWKFEQHRGVKSGPLIAVVVVGICYCCCCYGIIILDGNKNLPLRFLPPPQNLREMHYFQFQQLI